MLYQQKEEVTGEFGGREDVSVGKGKASPL
jgi:hypothetical protein